MIHQLEKYEARAKWDRYRCRLCPRVFSIAAGVVPIPPDDCEGQGGSIVRPPVPPKRPLISAGPVPPVPIRDVTHPQKYQGLCAKKPWDYPITVAIPCLDHAEETAICVELLRLQTVPCFFLLVDTGSRPEEFAKLEAMRAVDLEVHRLSLNGFQRPSDSVAFALDLCFSRADTPYVFTTHQDCFIRRRDFLEYLIREIEGRAVVGWRLSPRFHADWRQMFGHTATLFDLAEWDRIGATWTLRRAMRDGPREQDDPDHTVGCWPDTESAMNLTLLRSGAKTKFLGTEENFARNRDKWIDHVRSLVCSSLYYPEHNARAREWLADAMGEARQRVAAWRRPRGADLSSLPTTEGIEARKATCRTCPDERTEPQGTRLVLPVYCARDLADCRGCISAALGKMQSRVAGILPPCEKWTPVYPS